MNDRLLKTTVVLSVLVLAGMAFVGTAAAQEVVVDADGSGDYTSIQDAINSEGADSTITVNESSTGYDGFVVNNSNVTVRAAQGDAPVINGSTVSIGIGKTYAQVDANNATVQGLTITNVSTVPSQKNYVLVVSQGVSDSTVSNNIIQPGNNNHGVYIDGGMQSNVSISENVINGSGTPALMYAEGSLSANPASGVDVLDNTFIGSTNTDRALGHEVNDSTISGNAFTQVDVSIDVFGEVVNGESEPNAQRQALISQNDVAGTTVQIGSVGSGASESTDDIVDEAAQINVSVSSGNGVDESTIDVSVIGAGSTTDLVVNGTATDNVTATGSNATFENNQNDSIESVNVTAQLPEDKSGYDIDVSADDTTGATISNTFTNAFTVDMAGDALKVTADENNAFANNDGDGVQADEKATVSVVALDRFGNELRADDTNINVSRGDIALTSQDSSVDITKKAGGDATKGNEVTFTVTNTEVETVTLTALDTDGSDETLDSDSAQQTYVADIAGLEVTNDASNGELPADGSTEATITAQLVDSNGSDVPRGGIAVDYSIENSSAAGVGTPDGQSATTDSTGAASINITASNSGEVVTVTGIDQGTGNGFIGETSVETVAGDIDAGNSKFTIAGSETDISGVKVGTQHPVEVTLNDASDNPASGVTVDLSANSSGATFGSSDVTTNDTGVATTTLTLPEQKGTTQVNVTAGDFNATGTSDAQINVTTVAENATELRFAPEQSTTFAASSQDNTVTVQAVDEFGNINESVSGTVTLTSSDTAALDFDGGASATDALSNGEATFGVDANETAGSAELEATIPSDINNASLVFTVGEPQEIDVSFSSDLSTSSSDKTNSTATLSAQLLGPDGTGIAIQGENISFARQSGDSAMLDQSEDFVASTGSDGEATIQVNATDNTGQSAFLAIAENYSAQGTGTVTTTGPAATVDVTPEDTQLDVGNETTVTASFEDSQGRVVPRIDSINLNAEEGDVIGSPNNTEFVNGVAQTTFTYNATDASGSTNITAVGGGVTGTATVTVAAGPEPEASVTFEDETVQAGTENVTVDSANYTLADGTAGNYVAVAHVVRDDGSITGPVGYSANQSGSATEIVVDLNATEAQGDTLDTLTENTTLRAMLHETSPDSAFGPALTIGGQRVTDDANITVEPQEGPGPAPADLQVSNVQPDGANVTAGDDITVTADIENVGGQSGSQTAEFRLDLNQNGTLEASEELANKTVTVDAGSNTTVTFENVSTEGLAAGTYDHGVFTANNSATATVTVEEGVTAPADLQVSNVQPDGANVTAGDDITVTADIENVGGQSGSQTAEFRLDLNQNGTLEASEELANKTVTVDAGSNTTVTFENVSTEGLAAGTYDHGVFTANDSATATVTVEEETALFTEPLIGDFNAPPQNTGELDDTLYEDLNGDGDGVSPQQTVDLFGALIREEGPDLSTEQGNALDWNGDGPELTVEDLVELFGQQIRNQG